MAYRSIEYTKVELFCKVLSNTNTKEHFVLKKYNFKNTTSLENVPKLYNSKTKVKAVKLLDVQSLVAKYVPQEYLYFYKKMYEINKTTANDILLSEDEWNNYFLKKKLTSFKLISNYS